VIFTTTAIAGAITMALWMGVLAQHPIPQVPQPPCAATKQQLTIGALRCVDPMP
jgi:hypothetical protein